MGQAAKTCIVTTPFGTKDDPISGKRIDFDLLYNAAIRPAAVSLGLECRRLDEIEHGGSIHRSTLKAIVEADVFIADLTLLNSNVLYEVGIRHALSQRHTFLMMAFDVSRIPFDLQPVPIITYSIQGETFSIEQAGRLQDLLSERMKRRLDSDASDSPLYDSHLLDFSDVFEGLKLLPPQHLRHKRRLEDFRETADYDRSVFIMTKYPDPASRSDKDQALARVLDSVTSSVRKAGFKPKLASDREYYDNLWDNVELYLLGCSRGIAIVEDKYAPEMNPNIAMEWGWMRGMGKSVLFLVESDFRNLRADWQGLLQKTFQWDQPERDIPTHVRRWLKPAKGT